MFKRKGGRGGGGQRLFEQCSKKLHFFERMASLIRAMPERKSFFFNWCLPLGWPKALTPPFHTHTLYGQLFVIFLVVCLTPGNENMCSETGFTKEKRQFSSNYCKSPVPLDNHLQEAGPPDDHLQPCKGHEIYIFETLHDVFWVSKNQISMEKWIKIFTFA